MSEPTPRRRRLETTSKTTVNLPTTLLSKAKKVAEEQGVTLRELIEAGLEQQVAARRRGDAEFELRDASFGGDGLRPEWAGRSMGEILYATYPLGRGGSGEGGG